MYSNRNQFIDVNFNFCKKVRGHTNEKVQIAQETKNMHGNP